MTSDRNKMSERNKMSDFNNFVFRNYVVFFSISIGLKNKCNLFY